MPEQMSQTGSNVCPAGAAISVLGGKKRRFRHIFSALCLCAVLPVFAFILGFAVFVMTAANITLPSASVKADGIIVLTGGRARVETGLKLLQSGRAARLLVSGVSPMIHGNHSLAQVMGADTKLLECCVDLGWQAMNTSGNALESAAWVKKHDYHAVFIVTNRYHMLRSLAELRHKAPNVNFIPYPVEQTGGLFRTAENFRLFASEYLKFLVVSLRNAVN